MDKEQILQMAKKAGFYFMDAGYGPEVLHSVDHHYSEECFMRFAAAIRAATKEEDAKICESEPMRQRGDGVFACDQKACAEAIRASK